MPAKSQSQFRLMKAAEHNPKFAKKVGINPSVAKEYTESNVGKKGYSKLPEKMAKGGVSLSVGRGEKMPVERGAGLTAKMKDGGPASKQRRKSDTPDTYQGVKVQKLPYMGKPGEFVQSSLPVSGGKVARKPSLNDYDRDYMKKGGGVSLAVGRGEKLPADKGAGLTAKGRAKYNRETGSNLKAPQPQGGARRDSFCARMEPVAEKSEKGSRARASMKRWNCPGW
jgi:hypothetical protein